MRRTILISDDEPLVTSSLVRTAQRRGFHVLADHTCAAPEIAAEHHPDVIVLDMNQPTSGLALLERLKANEATRNIPVVMVTGWASQAERQAARDLHADYLELKPLSADFWDRIETWIDLKSREQLLGRDP